MRVKQCSRCNETKPISVFRFLVRQGRFMPWCRQCEAEHRKQSRCAINSRELAVKKVVELCKQYGTAILSDAVNELIGDR